MRHINRFAGLALAMAMLAPAAVAAQVDADLRIIVNPSVEASTLTLDDLRQIYLGNQRYWAGQKLVTPISRPAAVDAGKKFYKSVLQMTPARFHHHWTGIELSGRGVTPSSVVRADDVAALVQNNAGGIAFVTAEELKALARFKLKTVNIQE